MVALDGAVHASKPDPLNVPGSAATAGPAPIIVTTAAVAATTLDRTDKFMSASFDRALSNHP
jgi:hypothetical protein